MVTWQWKPNAERSGTKGECAEWKAVGGDGVKEGTGSLTNTVPTWTKVCTGKDTDATRGGGQACPP
jgi:hypothetical protein